MNPWSATLLIAGKDLRMELRSKDALNAAVAFSLVMLLLFSFAFDPDSEQAREIAGGLLWLVFTFAGTLLLNRSFARELPNDCLESLLASPIPAVSLLFGKATANWVLLLLVELLCLPVFGIFYNISWARQFGMLVLVLVLASWGIAVVGTVFGALTVNLRLREVMLPVLVYPILIPSLLGAILLSAHLIGGQPMNEDLQAWLRLLLGFDIIFSLLTAALADKVLVG
ncbi:MAG: heme exporter protein CcmB [Bryobacterales bacterium]|nr:heme exporter protein CcmB [Bryobacterales bacterium]